MLSRQNVWFSSSLLAFPFSSDLQQQLDTVPPAVGARAARPLLLLQLPSDAAAPRHRLCYRTLQPSLRLR